MVSITELVSYLDNLLEARSFSDYCPNGLQVQGNPQVSNIITGVTASHALIEAALEHKADTILVHHGYFWKGEDPCITGIKYRRMKTLLDADINLIAYHLPLDAHPVYGNNALLGEKLGLVVEGRFGTDRQMIAMHGQLSSEATVAEFANSIEAALDRAPLYIGDGDRPLQTVAWCTGAAQNYIEQAVALGVDAFVTGEASEQTVHIAREAGIAFFAAGHHATERYGVQALGDHLAENFDISHQFVDIDNPV